MKKYYPKLEGATVRATANISDSTHVHTMQEDGVSYIVDNTRVYMSSRLHRELDGVEVYKAGYQIHHVERMTNGKILVITYNNAIVIDDSTGTWIGTGEITRTGTWSEGGAIYNGLRGIDIHDNVIVLCSYGDKGVGKDFKAHISKDYGMTWNEIFSTRTDSPSPDNAHIHGIAFDKYRNYIWMIVGDDDNSRLMYSDTWGDTWINVETRPGLIPMLTEIFILPDAIVVGTDTAPDALIHIPFRDDRLQPSPDIERMTVSLLRNEQQDSNMFGFFLRGVANTDVYPHQIVAHFPGHGAYTGFHQLLYSYDGKKWYQIHGNQLHDGGKPENLRVGEIKIAYLNCITKPDFMIDGEPAGNIAWGKGTQWDGTSWNPVIVEVKLPEWVLVE